MSSAKASRQTKSVRQNPPAQPSTVVSACATASSCSDADEAITADSPRTSAAPPSTTESIVRLLRRPGSVCVKSWTDHERSADSAGPSRLTLVVVTCPPLRARGRREYRRSRATVASAASGSRVRTGGAGVQPPPSRSPRRVRSRPRPSRRSEREHCLRRWSATRVPLLGTAATVFSMRDLTPLGNHRRQTSRQLEDELVSVRVANQRLAPPRLILQRSLELDSQVRQRPTIAFQVVRGQDHHSLAQ
jgi:hypothetical protein